jgi:uncharacterized protein YrrD
MWKVSQLIGKSIVSGSNGERLGKVADVLLDADSHRVVGLVVAGGVLSSEHVLPYAQVQTLGTDAVIAQSATGLITAKEWHAQPVVATRTSALTKKRVLTTSGRAVGDVRDILLDENGMVDALEVSGAGLFRRRSTVSSSPGLTIGSDAVLIPDDIPEPEHRG